MINQIFLTLPVADLQRSVSFFKALGFIHNPQFSDDTAACIVMGMALGSESTVGNKLSQYAGGPDATVPKPEELRQTHPWIT